MNSYDYFHNLKNVGGKNSFYIPIGFPACSAVWGWRSYKVTEVPVAAEFGRFQFRIPAIGISHSFRKSNLSLLEIICDLFKGEATKGMVLLGKLVVEDEELDLSAKSELSSG